MGLLEYFALADSRRGRGHQRRRIEAPFASAAQEAGRAGMLPYAATLAAQHDIENLIAVIWEETPQAAQYVAGTILQASRHLAEKAARRTSQHRPSRRRHSFLDRRGRP